METTESRAEDREVVTDTPEPLKYRTWVLKVSIHCEGCKRKIKKILKNTDGVYTTDIDRRQQKVIVTGNVEAETLIKKIVKAGRHAELWQENNDRKDKKPKKPKNKEKESEEEESSEEDNDDNEGGSGGGGVVGGGGGGGAGHRGNGATGKMGVLVRDPKHEVKQAVSFISGGQPPVVAESPGGGAGRTGAKKKKKKKRKNKNNSNAGEGPQSNNAPASTVYSSPPGPPTYPTIYSPPRQHCGRPPPSHYHAPPTAYTVSYNTAHPSSGVYIASYYKSAPSYYSYGHVYQESGSESPPSDFDSYPSQPSDSYELFTDENPNACSIM